MRRCISGQKVPRRAVRQGVPHRGRLRQRRLPRLRRHPRQLLRERRRYHQRQPLDREVSVLKMVSHAKMHIFGVGA